MLSASCDSKHRVAVWHGYPIAATCSRLAYSAAGYVAAAMTLLLTLAGPARAIVVRPDVPVTAFNELALRPEYSSVLWLGDNTVPGGGIAAVGCNGILISPTTILTAAHCVTGMDPSKIAFGNDPNVPATLPASVVSSVVVNPGFEGSFGEGIDHDEALLRLSQPVTSIAPAILWTGDITGETATMVGYGEQDYGDYSLNMCAAIGSLPCPAVTRIPGANERLAATNTIFTFESQPGSLVQGLWSADFDTPLDSNGNSIYGVETRDSDAMAPLEGMICYGDSGGGLFVTINGKTMLAGTATGIDTTNTYLPNYPGCGYGTSGYWAGAGIPENVAWMSAVDPAIVFEAPAPEPSSLILLGDALLTMFAARRIGRGVNTPGRGRPNGG